MSLDKYRTTTTAIRYMWILHLVHIIPSLFGTATGGGRCELPGRFVDRGGGAGLSAEDRGTGLPDADVLAGRGPRRLDIPLLRVAEAMGGGDDRMRLGTGETTDGSGDVGAGPANGKADTGVRAEGREGVEGKPITEGNGGA